MSTFIEQIRRLSLGEKPYRIALPGKLTTIQQDSPTIEGHYATRFTVKVEVGSTLVVHDSQTGAVQLQEAARGIQRAIAHEIYADVRKGLMELWPDVIALRGDGRQFERSMRMEEKLAAILADIEP